MILSDLGILVVTVVTCALAVLVDRGATSIEPVPVVHFCRRCRDRSVRRRSELCRSCTAAQADAARYGLDVWW